MTEAAKADFDNVDHQMPLSALFATWMLGDLMVRIATENAGYRKRRGKARCSIPDLKVRDSDGVGSKTVHA